MTKNAENINWIRKLNFNEIGHIIWLILYESYYMKGYIRPVKLELTYRNYMNVNMNGHSIENIRS